MDLLKETLNLPGRLNQFLTQRIEDSNKLAKGVYTERTRPIGSQATLEGRPVYWSGQNYGWQSKESYQKLSQGPEFRGGHIAASRLQSDISATVNYALKSLPTPVKQTAKTVVKSIPKPVTQALESAVNVASSANEALSKATNISPIITGELATTVATAGAGKILANPLTTASMRYAKLHALQAVTGKRQYFPPLPTARQAVEDLIPMLPSKPRNIGAAGNIKRVSMSNVAAAIGADAEDITHLLSKPWHSTLKSKYQHMPLKDFASNKGGWLDELMSRDQKIEQGLEKYTNLGIQKASSTRKSQVQRQTYDVATLNPLDPEPLIYDNRSIRTKITKLVNSAMGTEWHHIFGNKEAAETLLTEIAQDPYITMNLMVHLKKLNLPTSGTPSNIAMMKKVPHNKFHRRLEQINRIEKSNFEIQEMAKAVSDAVLAGETDINEIFTLLEVYKRYNDYQRKLMKSEYGAEIVSELKPLKKFSQTLGRKARTPKVK